MYKLVCYFDGSCETNPGNCFASYKIGDESSVVVPLGYGTNNIAEYSGLKELLVELNRRNEKSDILINGDSMLVVKGANGNWKIKNPRLAILNKGVLKELKKLRKESKITIRWIGRDFNLAHVGDTEDELTEKFKQTMGGMV